jgi:hypothetical protein
MIEHQLKEVNERLSSIVLAQHHQRIMIENNKNPGVVIPSNAFTAVRRQLEQEAMLHELLGMAARTTM